MLILVKLFRKYSRNRTKIYKAGRYVQGCQEKGRGYPEEKCIEGKDGIIKHGHQFAYTRYTFIY